MFSSIHKDLVCWSPSRCAPKQRMKLESPCERAFDVSPLTFLLVAQEVAAIDASYRKVIPVQEIILVCEKTEVRNFLCVLSLVSSPIITYFQEFKTKNTPSAGTSFFFSPGCQLSHHWTAAVELMVRLCAVWKCILSCKAVIVTVPGWSPLVGI